MKNAEYRQIKKNTLFGLDQKSQFKTNNCLIFPHFFMFMSNSAKNMLKWVKYEQKRPKIPNIQHYLTVFDIIQL